MFTKQGDWVPVTMKTWHDQDATTGDWWLLCQCTAIKPKWRKRAPIIKRMFRVRRLKKLGNTIKIPGMP